MASINFVDQLTPVPASWLNDVNNFVYNGVGTPTGSNLVGYTQGGTGAVTRTVAAKLQESVSVKDFGAVGDGVTDDTAAINAANTYATGASKTLLFPAGTYLATGLPAIAGMRWIGEGVTQTTLKLKSGTNAGLVTSATTNIDDVYIAHMRFDGNSAGNTSGDTLVVKGCRTAFVDITVVNSAGNGIVTDWNVANSFRLTGCEGFFSHITIDSAQQTGWSHSGPSDSHFESVIIIDPGIKTNNSFYGMYLAPGSGNGRFINLHSWIRSTTTNAAISGVYVGSAGNTFTDCHFEGGQVALSIAGGANSFESCHYYAPRSTAAVNITGSSNILTGVLGDVAFSGNPNYVGILLSSSNNMIDVVDVGCINGCIDFTLDAGLNNVRVVGNRSTGIAYGGIPASTDTVNIAIGGAGGGTFFQLLPVTWTTFVPAVSTSNGTLTSFSVAGRYRLLGKVVELEVTITITNNGTGATALNFALPIAAGPGKYVLVGREDGVSGKMTQGRILAGATACNVFFYDGTYPGATGAVVTINGSYESV